VLAPAAIGLGAGGLRVLAVALLVLFAVSVARWWKRTWSFDGRVLQVESGLLARSSQIVPAERVQQVTVVEKLRHRLFGVASLRVEVAGGGGGLELEALGVADAHRLRDALLAAKVLRAAPATTTATADGPGAADQPVWVPHEWTVVRLGFRELALAGVTGPQLLLFLAFTASALQLAGELPGELFDRVRSLDLGLAEPALLAVGLLAFLAVWLGSAIAASVLRDGGYDLALVGEELHLRRGLLDRKESVLPLARVQAVRVTASPLRRALGFVSFRLQGAGAGTDREERRVVVPLLRVTELDRVLSLVLPGLPGLPELTPPPPAARRRAVVRRVVPAAVVAVAFAVFLWPWGVAALLLVPGAAALGQAAYRGLGHARLPSSLVTRTGALTRQTVVVPADRVQSARSLSSPFQRRLDLATLAVDVAGPGGSPRVVDVGAATAGDLLHWVTDRSRR
jgi:putative membrane protein